MINVTLYTREDCHLCEEIKNDLESLQEQYPHRLVEVDVDSDSALYDAYGQDIPVVEVGPYRLSAPISRQDLAMTIGAAYDRHNQLAKIGDEAHQKRVQRGQTITGTDSFSYWVSRHYMAVIAFFLFLYTGLPVLAPVLMKVGATARRVFRILKPRPAFFIYTIPTAPRAGMRATIEAMKSLVIKWRCANVILPFTAPCFSSRCSSPSPGAASRRCIGSCGCSLGWARLGWMASLKSSASLKSRRWLRFCPIGRARLSCVR
ncbi:MAG: hypothetical protein B6I38_03180 [Anaerolineaceae bacterium 4572_5.1]|nr:MAG: hypothetical protein B6I38_03180 [Anaerolineaceae bacterium 4572_5.1]